MQGVKVRAQKEVKVDGEKYTITRFSAIKGLKFQKYLLKVFGSAWVEAEAGQNPTIASILVKVIDNIDEIDENVLAEMVCLSLEMMPQDFDYKFSGKTMSVFKLLKEIVFFNYEDLFTMLGMEEMEAAVLGQSEQPEAEEQ